MTRNRRSRNSLVDQIVGEIRETILACKLQPGDLLPSQKDLAAQYNVGLSTIHEAIQVLIAVGLVEARPGKGTWVRADAGDTLIHPAAVKSRLGELNARQLVEARSVIEVGLVRLAAQRATAKDVQSIQTAMRAIESAKDNATFVAADIEYHLTVARAGHSQLLEQFYFVARQLLEQVAAELIVLPGVIKESLPLQAAVAQAIEQHDVHKAEQAALAHMRYIEKLLDQYE